MRSSACKYLLDKVSTFEKKYAKPIQKFNKNEDDDFLSSKENSSEHAVNKVKFIETHFQVSEDINCGERVNEVDPLEYDTRDDLDFKDLSKSCQDTFETNKKVTTYVMQKDKCTECADARYEYKDIVKMDKKLPQKVNDTTESLLTEHSTKDNLSTKKNVKSNEPKTSFTVEEEDVNKGCLHVNLNLKFLEDHDEISDISSKDIASFSLENSKSSQNVPINVFAFEDLIGADELKSVSEGLKGNFEENIQLNAQTFSPVAKSDRTAMLIADNLQLNLKPGDDMHEISRNSSEERLKEDIDNIDELSIEEDIEEEEENIESSDSEKFNEAFEQINSSSETKVGKNAFMLKNNESSRENITRVDQYKDNHSSDESIPDFVEDDNRQDIYLQKSKSNVIHEVENSENQLIKYELKEYSKIKNHSDSDLKAAQDKHNRPKERDFKHFKDMKKSLIREKYLEKEWKLLAKSKNALQDELHNAYTQTENFLAKTYNFEKKMETIMKTSLTSMTEVNNFTLEINNVHSKQTPHSASIPTPLERGFNCALKQQVELTKHFICAEYNMYAVCMAAIKEMSSSYKPTMLHYTRKKKSNSSSRKPSS